MNTVRTSLFVRLNTFLPWLNYSTDKMHFYQERNILEHKRMTPKDVDISKNFFRESAKIMVVTGAGISVESGIPDRNECKKTTPNYKELDLNITSEGNVEVEKWKKFWVQAFLIYDEFMKVKPNPSHEILYKMECSGLINWLVTKNADSLHLLAKSKNAIEMYGSARYVKCEKCKSRNERKKIQEQMKTENKGLNLDDIKHSFPKRALPNIDFDYNSEQKKIINQFKIPICQKDKCSGKMKPDFISFTIEEEVKKKIDNMFADADGILIIGTSLEDNYIPQKLIEAANARKLILIVNIGVNDCHKYLDDIVNDSNNTLTKKVRNGDRLICSKESGEIRMRVIEADCKEFLMAIYEAMTVRDQISI